MSKKKHPGGRPVTIGAVHALHCFLDDDAKAALEAVATATKWGKSQIVREALKAFAKSKRA